MVVSCMSVSAPALTNVGHQDAWQALKAHGPAALTKGTTFVPGPFLVQGKPRGQSPRFTFCVRSSLPSGRDPPKSERDVETTSQIAPLGRAGLSMAAMSLYLLQAFAPIPPPGAQQLAALAPQAAEAVLNSPDTAGRLPRSGEVALRRSIPAVNPAMKSIQGSLEELFYLLRIPQRKPYGTMESNVKKAVQLAKDNRAAILAAVPGPNAAKVEQLYDQMLNGKGAMEGILSAIQLQDADKIASRLVATLETVADIMLLQAPGLPYPISNQFNELPRLTGRAVVEFTVSRPDGMSFTVAEGGGPQGTGVFEVVLDGFSAPLTTGNFAKLLQQGVYNGVAVKATSEAILAEAKSGAGTELPLEVMPAGEEAPIYRTPLDVQDGEIPVLPMSVYGSVCMSHALNSDTSSHPSQFFIYLYDRRNSGLGGLSFEEGQFSVFGYVTKGRDILSQVRTGDVIKSAKIISGQDRLVIPSAS